ncbi:MAG TPA: type II secretion system protein GspM, partial [Gammaproteobacteria bacterium]
MAAFVTSIQKQLDKLSKRERISVYVSVSVVVLMLWDFVLLNPLSNEINNLRNEITQIDKQIDSTVQLIQGIQQSLQADPDVETRALLAEYAAENKRLELALAKTSVQIISPQDMAHLLEDILKNQSQLKFISLQNIPATPEFLDIETSADTNTKNQDTIFRHSVVLKMEGSYHDTLAYLHKLEKLPWRFFWKSIEIETKNYPAMQITL